MTAPAMTLGQFAAQHGLTTSHDVQAHIDAGLRCAPDTTTYRRWYAARLTQLQDERDATTRAYRDAVEAGVIREPTRTERLRAVAAGHDDNPTVQAARRLLAKESRA